MTRARQSRNRRSLVVPAVLLAALAGAAACWKPPESRPAAAWLVRHAEKEDGDDPALTAAGHARAEALAARLEDEGVERILSTDTRRTRETAAPLARRTGLEVELYDHEELKRLADMLREEHRSVLVVGHSNTTSELVGLLGGEPGAPIAEGEYDRLYRVDLADGTTVREPIEP